ncbi:hypothetical protein HMPREF3214_00702 [Alloscardovia omnicolens]|nr:hypothetical protein HMPREF3214_00702 [Alloscardovia omnicolens]
MKVNKRSVHISIVLRCELKKKLSGICEPMWITRHKGRMESAAASC